MSDFSAYFRQVSPRTKVMAWIILVIFCVFVVRLFYLQVIRHDYYVEKAHDAQVTKLTIFPERGLLYARDGENLAPLVLNETVYTVFADPLEVGDVTKVKQTLRRVAGGEVLEKSFASLTDKSLRYVVLARQVSRTQVEMIKKEDLSGVGFQKGSRRVYPERELASQLLGYVNNDGQGQYGIEESLEARLRGEAGLLQAVTDVRRIPLTIGKDSVRKPVKNGDNLVLTVDRNIQTQTEQFLKTGLERAKATKGSVVVMNPQNGNVLAMANYPTYDPAKYQSVEDYAVFQNGVVSQPYENGSVMKTLTVGAGLDSGAVTVSSTFNDSSGCVQVADRRICNVEEDPNLPNASMEDVLRYSLNTGVVHVLSQMGGGSINQQARNTLYRYFHDQYRFGQLTGIEQAGESRGTIIAPDQQEGNNVRYANMAFGQGMDQTMIQTVAAFSASINGGTYYKPTLVYGVYREGKVEPAEPQVVAQNVLQSARSAELRDLIWQGRKKGFFGIYDSEGYKIGGKTGTSQVVDPRTGQYSDSNSIGSYLGFGGAETPQYVIMVRVDDAKVGGYAGTTAAGPIFNDLSKWLIEYLNIRPMS